MLVRLGAPPFIALRVSAPAGFAHLLSAESTSCVHLDQNFDGSVLLALDPVLLSAQSRVDAGDGGMPVQS